MTSPLKYKPVNWVDGMKISSSHFISTDNFIQDISRDSTSVFLNSNTFGLLPPFNGESSSLAISITARASNHLQIKIGQCNAVAADGARINIPRAPLNEEYVFDHYFGQDLTTTEVAETYFVILAVNPFERVPAGNPDPEEAPLRYPSVEKQYTINVIPASQLNTKSNQYFEVGKFTRSNGNIQVAANYIPPCTTVLSHPLLVSYYETFSNQLNEFQLLSFRIIDKITSKDSISPIGKNVKLLCDKMLDYIAHIFFNYRNVAYNQPPIYLVGYFSEMAHLFFSTVKSISGAEREELLKYFYEWKDVTPGNFEELLARLIEVVYNHHDIQSSMQQVDDFLKVMVALWNKLSSLEYIGQRKENIVVAEQQVIQAVQAKRTWTLLD
ncbi:hypothetical protein GCM10027037_26550 [Mucilaginibacter koreensis]